MFSTQGPSLNRVQMMSRQGVDSNSQSSPTAVPLDVQTHMALGSKRARTQTELQNDERKKRINTNPSLN